MVVDCGSRATQHTDIEVGGVLLKNKNNTRNGRNSLNFSTTVCELFYGTPKRQFQINRDGQY